VVELGREYGTIDLEALAAARPDVIVTNAYPVDSAGTIDPNAPLYGFTDLAQQQAAARIAPIVAVTMDGSAVQVVERTERLAAALGADPALIDAGRAEYVAARERLRGVAAAHPVVAPHSPSKATRAAATAASTSSGPPSGTTAHDRPV